MSDRVWVATRKGLLALTGTNKNAPRWRIARTSFLGDSVTMTLRDPRDGSLYAALRLGHFGPKLRRSDDGGATWGECAVPAFPAAGGDDENAPSVDMIWKFSFSQTFKYLSPILNRRSCD